MNKQELLSSFADGKRDFSFADLSGADLSDANLSGADLSGADLSGAHLSGADLSGANLSGADLTRADLTRADLTRADLRRANLYGAHLSGADLRWANLYGADLTSADLYLADLQSAALSGANLPVSSHDAIAEILRVAAGTIASHRMIAGCVLVSRDWCWHNFARIIRVSEGSERLAWLWALNVLKEWECFCADIEELEQIIGVGVA